MEAVVYTCLGLMFIFGILAVMLHSMTKSAIALAAGSAVLGIIMYELGFIWAALFEISVCSGLVTVLFVSAISLSNTSKNQLEKVYEDKKRMSLLPVILIISGVILVIMAIWSGISLKPADMPVTAGDNLREILWNNRQSDIWGQIILMITGSVAVVVLFRDRGHD